MSTIQERIRQLIDAEAGGVQRRFALATGIEPYQVNKVLVQGRTPDADFIGAILRTYPRINPWWLLLGAIPQAGAPPPKKPVGMYATRTPTTRA